MNDNCFGRLTIYSSTDFISIDNVMSVVNEALNTHIRNLVEEEYLYWYRRGVQPVLHRVKERNKHINNHIVCNHAAEIVDFKNGYFLTQPAYYISRRKGSQRKVDKLNEQLYLSGKHDADNELADWFHTVGKAALFVSYEPGEEIPVRAYALDPRSAFVVYSMRPGNPPVMGVNMVETADKLRFDVYTRDRIYRLEGTQTGRVISAEKTFVATATEVISDVPNPLGDIPIIEYAYNNVNQSAFEPALSLLDAISDIQSNRADGVAQFIQSIAVGVNCNFEDDTTAEDIKKAGMILLRSNDGNKADFKILSDELDQTQTQVLLDSLREQVWSICAVPCTSRTGTSIANTSGTAALATDGWYQADASARNTTDLFIRSNRRFDKIFTDILRREGLIDIKLSDFELNFVRNETANILSKAQAFNTLMASGMHPELAAAKSGVSNDPVSDIKMSDPYIKMIWGDPTAADKTEQVDGGEGEAAIIEGFSGNGENSTEGTI